MAQHQRLVLAVNAGSSSIKVSVYTLDPNSSSQTPHELAEIQVAGLTAPPATLTYDRKTGTDADDAHIKGQKLSDVSNSQDAYKYILQHLIDDRNLEQFAGPESIAFVCHRVVHGGDYAEPARIDKTTFQRLEELSDLAPLHNAGALEIVQAVHDQCPDAVNVAFFDSAFHQTLPEPTRTYAIDPKIARHNKLRKYGFHGLSYAYITRTVADWLEKPAGETNLIALHLGSGCSACAIRGGASIATTMGLTPLSGLPGATRSGDVDPSLIFHFTHDAGRLSPSSSKDLHITTAEEILNKKSGWAALTGTTDFGEVSKRADEGDADAKLAFEILVDRLLDSVAAYYVKLEGKVDALVFAGGIGEKGVQLRAALTQRLACLGFGLDDGRNHNVDSDAAVAEISAKESRHRVLVVQTDEQAEMARQCALLADQLGK